MKKYISSGFWVKDKQLMNLHRQNTDIVYYLYVVVLNIFHSQVILIFAKWKVIALINKLYCSENFKAIIALRIGYVPVRKVKIGTAVIFHQLQPPVILPRAFI